MPRDINFVRERQRQLTKQEIGDKKLFKVSLVAVSILGALCLVVIGIRLFLVFRYKQVSSQQETLRAQIVSREEIEKSFTIFSHKLKILTDLFGKRKEKQETLAYFSNLFGSDVIIGQLSYDSSIEVLSFTLQAKSIFVMKDVFDIMNSVDMETRYPKLEKSSLGRGSDGTYSMNIMIGLGEAPLPQAAAAAEQAAGTTDGVPAVGGEIAP